ncbi:MAG: ACP S-malonyltransferase [delta proteobacterium ML8_F1]|nr:MAG: ACP S-malonyltransferase [delta proteobacterium ML8_F1]
MGKIAFIFPGQGAQYPGMGKEIHEAFPVAREVFDRASAVLGYDMAKVCFQGTEEDLRQTEITQPAILTVSYAMARVLLEKGVRPGALAGLSLGEYSALVLGGALSFDEALGVVVRRGKIMQEEVPAGRGMMAAILGLENHLVETACQSASSWGIVEPVNYNCPGQLVIAGEVEAVTKGMEIAKSLGAKKTVALKVSAPFHTSLLAGAGEKLRGVLEQVVIKPLEIPVINNVAAQENRSPEDTFEKLVQQVYRPVLWEDSVNYLIEEGFDTFIEVGPSRSLSNFVKRISKEVTVLNVEDLKSLHKTIEALGGAHES